VILSQWTIYVSRCDWCATRHTACSLVGFLATDPCQPPFKLDKYVPMTRLQLDADAIASDTEAVMYRADAPVDAFNGLDKDETRYWMTVIENYEPTHHIVAYVSLLLQHMCRSARNTQAARQGKRY
jgi:hypothetical protein